MNSIRRNASGPRPLPEIATRLTEPETWEQDRELKQGHARRAAIILATSHPELLEPLLGMLRHEHRVYRLAAALHPLLRGRREIVSELKQGLTDPLNDWDEPLWGAWTRMALRLAEAGPEHKAWLEPKALQKKDLSVLAKLGSEHLLALASQATESSSADREQTFAALLALGPTPGVSADLLHELGRNALAPFSPRSSGEEHRGPFWGLLPLAFSGVPRALDELIERLPLTQAALALFGPSIADDLARTLTGPLRLGALSAYQLLETSGAAEAERETFVQRVRDELPTLLLTFREGTPKAWLAFAVRHELTEVSAALVQRVAADGYPSEDELEALRRLGHPEFSDLALRAGKQGRATHLLPYVGTREALKLFDKKAPAHIKARTRVNFPDSGVTDVEQAAASGNFADAFARAAELGFEAVVIAADASARYRDGYGLQRTAMKAALQRLARNAGEHLEELTWHDNGRVAIFAREVLDGIASLEDDPALGSSTRVPDVIASVTRSPYPELARVDAEQLVDDVSALYLPMSAARYDLHARFAHEERITGSMSDGRRYVALKTPGTWGAAWHGRVAGRLLLDQRDQDSTLLSFPTATAARTEFDRRLALVAADKGYEVAWCDHAPLEVKLTVLNSKRRDQRERALSSLEDSALASPLAIPAGAQIYLAGKPKYYEPAELVSHIQARGWQVTPKVQHATFALVMIQPKKALDAILKAKLPVLFELQLKQATEAGAPEVLRADSPALDNVQAMLLSAEAKNVSLALELLKAGVLPLTVLSSLLALTLFGADNELRAAAKKVLLAKAPEGVAKRFENDRRNYASLSDPDKLVKLAKELQDLGVEPAEFTRHALVLATHPKSKQRSTDVLSAALRFDPEGKELFQLIPGGSFEATSVSLTGLRGSVPTGIRSMLELEQLHLYQSRFTEGVLHSTSVRSLRVQGGTLYALSALEGLTNLTRLEIARVVIPGLDLSPLSKLTHLKELSLGVRESDRTRFESYQAPSDLTQKHQRVDLSPLGTLLNLESLELDGPVLDLGPLVALPDLKELKLLNAPVADFSPLAKLGKLQRVVTSPKVSKEARGALQRLLPGLTLA